MVARESTPKASKRAGTRSRDGDAERRSPQTVEWTPGQLGQTLRALRLARGLSINDLARQSDLSGSFLSQVETGQSDLSVGRLFRIAQALGVSAADFLNGPNGARGPVVRAEDRVKLPIRAKGVDVYVLASTLDKKRTFSYGTLQKGAKIPMPVRNRGSEYFIYVIDGAMKFDFVSGETVTLYSGDSTARISDECRSLENAADGITSFVWSQAARTT